MGLTILDLLSTNKGTVSSALGKTLAQQVLQEGRSDIPLECIDLSSYEAASPGSKHIRAGAAKVVEIQGAALAFAAGWQDSSRKNTQQRATKVLKL